jgi:hypothetical protein
MRNDMKTLIEKNNTSLSYVKETLRGSEFATHRTDAKGSKYWGHYFTDFDKAKADFEKRAGIDFEVNSETAIQ